MLPVHFDNALKERKAGHRDELFSISVCRLSFFIGLAGDAFKRKTENDKRKSENNSFLEQFADLAPGNQFDLLFLQ